MLAAFTMREVIVAATPKVFPNCRFLVPHSMSYPGIILIHNHDMVALSIRQPDSYLTLRIDLATMQYEASWDTFCDGQWITGNSGAPVVLTESALLNWMQKGHIDTNDPRIKSEAAELFSLICNLAESKEATPLDANLEYFSSNKIEGVPPLPGWALCVFVLSMIYVIWGFWICICAGCRRQKQSCSRAG